MTPNPTIFSLSSLAAINNVFVFDQVKKWLDLGNDQEV